MLHGALANSGQQWWIQSALKGVSRALNQTVYHADNAEHNCTEQQIPNISSIICRFVHDSWRSIHL
jgi:hypothetical protein